MNKNIRHIIEATNTHIKYVQAKRTGRQMIVSVVALVPFLGGSDDDLVRIIQQFSKQYKLQTEDVVVSIPRQLIILKLLNLPASNSNEIKKMIALQLKSQIPYSLDDVTYDYLVVDKNSSGYTKTLVMVIHNDIYHKYQSAFARAGIKNLKMSVSSLGILGWMNYQQQSAGKKEQDVICSIEVDYGHTELVFIQNENILYSRDLKFGVRDILGEDSDEFVKQILLSLAAYKQERMGPPIKGVKIISSVKDVKVLGEKIIQGGGYRVEYFTSLDNILSQKNIDLDAFSREPYVSAAVAIGLAVDPQEKLLNFVPKVVNEKKETGVRNVQLIQFCILTVITCVLAIGIMSVDVFKLSTQLKNINLQAESLLPKIKEIDQKALLVKSFNEQKSRYIFINDVFSELFRFTSDGISFRIIELNQDRKFVVQGYGDDSANINAFQSRLVKSSFFQDVNLEYATKRRIFNMDVTDFRISMRIKFTGEEL